jgi:hypothetical protein
MLHTASSDWGQISLGRRNHQPQGGGPSLCFPFLGTPLPCNLNSDLLLVLGNWLILLYILSSKTRVSIYLGRIFPSNFFFTYSFLIATKFHKFTFSTWVRVLGYVTHMWTQHQSSKVKQSHFPGWHVKFMWTTFQECPPPRHKLLQVFVSLHHCFWVFKLLSWTPSISPTNVY